MACIDFDSRFTRFLRVWLDRFQDEYADIEQLEQQMPHLYRLFADSPAPWLDGRTPRNYFEEMQDPGQLVNLIGSYIDEGVPLPDLLLERIAGLGDIAERALIQTMQDTSAQEEARMVCIRLLQELGSLSPMETYIAWQVQREDHDDLADFALESLEEMGEAAVPLMLEALETANDCGREALLSVLSRYPGHPAVYEGLIRLFDALPERQAILAAYLGRLGDERAVPLLQARAMEEGLGYLDYIELRAAIEALGGEAPERQFEDDPEYEAMRGLESP